MWLIMRSRISYLMDQQCHCFDNWPWLTAEYPAVLKQPLRVGGYAYPRIRVCIMVIRK